MPDCSVLILPQNKTVLAEEGSSLLSAVASAGITLTTLCGGEGTCGRCKMIVKSGRVSGGTDHGLEKDEVAKGVVLACQARLTGDLSVEVPPGSAAGEKSAAGHDISRFKEYPADRLSETVSPVLPLVRKVHLRLTPPTLENSIADHQNLVEAMSRRFPGPAIRMDLAAVRALPELLRANDFKITATLGVRPDNLEILNVEGHNTEAFNHFVIVDIGTTTVVAHLVNAQTGTTEAARACFNSQGVFGGEVTRRIIAAEKQGAGKLQEALIKDLNGLVEGLVKESGVALSDITALVCVGNTIMSHFLLKLPTRNIRRTPYVPASVEFPPVRAAELDLKISPRGLVYTLPAVSGWVGSDITAGILSTGIHKSDALSLLIDIGTNGEVVVGNRDWIMATSASAGPALEGASVECGMRAENGAIEKVRIVNNELTWTTIGNAPARGLCGSGILDLVAALLKRGIIDRSGHFIAGSSPKITTVDNIDRYVFSEFQGRPLFISTVDLENIITAKAAIFAAVKILLKRLKLSFGDLDRLFLGGAFGNYLNIESAITIGLIPDLPRDKILYAGNTAIKGAKMAALNQEHYKSLGEIAKSTTYYDLMGAADYVEEFRKAMFLPHTDLDEFHGAAGLGAGS